MIVAAAVCPHPPMIVPALAAGAAPELDGLRRACDAAVARLTGTCPGPAGAERGVDAVVLVGGDDHRAFTGFAPWGVDTRVSDEPLPLSLLVGQWLLARSGWGGGSDRSKRAVVPVDAPVAVCVERGRRLAAEPRRLGLLVLGDGSRCRGVRAPGYDDPRAAPYDEAVAAALAEADAQRLLALDEGLSAELGVAGRAAWQVLAAAVQADAAPHSGDRWRGELLYHDAPYGVAYLVASWSRVGDGGGA